MASINDHRPRCQSAQVYRHDQNPKVSLPGITDLLRILPQADNNHDHIIMLLIIFSLICDQLHTAKGLTIACEQVAVPGIRWL